MGRFTRRQVLKVGAVGLGGITLRCAHHRPESKVERPIELIDHVVVIYQENWSFDSLFGKFPGANGIASALETVRQVDRAGQHYAALPASIDNSRPPGAPDPRIPTNLPVKPFDLGAYVQPNQRAGNPLHRYYQHIFQIDGGRMDKFIAWSNAGGLAMSYYDGTNLPLG